MSKQFVSRLWLPILVALATIVVAFVLREHLATQENAEISAMARSQTMFARSQAEARMASRILVLTRLANRWEIWGKPTKTDWDLDATFLMSGYPNYQAIEWVDPTYHARWIEPFHGNEIEQDLDFHSDPERQRALEAAQDIHDVVVTRPIDLRQGGRGFLVCVPIFAGKNLSGFIVGVFRYQEILGRILESVAGDYLLAVLDDGQEIYSRPTNNGPQDMRWLQVERINLGTHIWELRVWPKPETVTQAQSPLPEITLVVGLFVAGLLAAVFYSAQTAKIRAQEIVAANQELKKEIAERQDMEVKLHHSQKMEAIGRLAGGVAHDFNNLLMIIRGSAMLSLKSSIAPGPPRKNLEDILKAAERASSLTRQLLAFSRKQVLQPRVLNLNALVTQVAELLPPLIGEDIHLVLNFDPELGRVKADPGKVEQVLMNLVVNARDAMPEGGELTIQTSNVNLDETASGNLPKIRPGPHVMLAVKDTGHGMDAETVSRVFEPFFSTKEKDKGTGLGLATAYGIVEQSGGAISVFSEPGRGTAFTIYFPRTDDRSEEVELRKGTTRNVEGSETVLVVEDDDGVRKMTRTFLTLQGYTVLEARDAAEAIRIAERKWVSIDLVLTDLIMPGIKGRELVERILNIRHGLPVLYMSGYTEDAVINNGTLDVGTAFIEKPFGPDDLTCKVRELLESSERHMPASIPPSRKI